MDGNPDRLDAALRELGALVRSGREHLSEIPSQTQAGELIGRSKGWWLTLEAGRLDPQLGDLIRVASLIRRPLLDLLAPICRMADGDGTIKQVATAPDWVHAQRPAALPVGSSPTPESEDMQRRAFARYLALVGAIGMMRPGALASAIVPADAGTDSARADALHDRTLRYMELWDELPPAILLAAVLAHLDVLRQVADSTQSPQVARQLQFNASETAAFAGMLGWYLQDRALAEIGLSAAERYGAIAGHSPVQSIVLAIRGDFHSHLQAGRHEGSSVTRSLLDAALRTVGTSPSPVRAWILLRQAEEFAVIGNAKRAYELLDIGDAVLAAVHSMPRGMFRHWNMGIHHGFRGNCAQLLGKYTDSLDILGRTLVGIDPGAVSIRLALQADMAAVHARQGDPETSTNLLSSTLTVAVHAGLRDRVHRVAGIRSTLLGQYHNHPSVRAFDEQLHALAPNLA